MAPGNAPQGIGPKPPAGKIMKRILVLTALVLSPLYGLAAAEVTQPVSQRFAQANAEDQPDFRRHVVPLLGKLGCNGRACHGSFQGKGGFRLSLFGYDFKMDHEGLADRIDTDDPAESYALQKATLQEPHRGGKRTDKGSWAYNVLLKWIADGAPTVDLEHSARFERLEVSPSEIRLVEAAAPVQLQVVAVWSDGSREDVTCLCRFQTNDDSIAEVTKGGQVTGLQPGDTNVVVFYDNGVQPVPVLRPISGSAVADYPQIQRTTRIDGLVVDKLAKLGIVPSPVAGDTEFLRRVSLDMTGTLPSPAEIREFVADSSSDKRARKINELLERPTYAAWWATRFADWTGNSDDKLNNVAPRTSPASRDWYEWLAARIGENVPYHEIARGFVMAQSREPNESYMEYCQNMARLYKKTERGEKRPHSYAERSTMPHYWARNNFRTAEDRAIGFAYNFLGTRIQCAQCHKHPFDQWTMDDFHQFKNFFVNTRYRNSPDTKKFSPEILAKLEVDKKLKGGQLRRALREVIEQGKVTPFEEVWTARVAAKKAKPAQQRKKKNNRRTNTAREAKLLGAAETTDLSQFDDPRQPLMDWLLNDKKQLFAKAIVNRIWSCYFNVGIVEPPDDLSLANPPSNAPLLDYLTQAFVENGYDLKWLHREIANSDTYQRTWLPTETNRDDQRNFSRSVPRRLPAEVALDAIVAATSADQTFAEMHTRLDGRHIAISSAGSRYNDNAQNYALSVFGRSIRESNCDCDRSQEPSLLQTVFLQNDGYMYSQIDRGRGGWIHQVATELGLQQTRFASKSGNTVQPQIQAYKRQLSAARKQLKEAKKAQDETALKRAQRRMAVLEQRLQSLEKPSPRSANVQQQTEQHKLPNIVRSTYLRTLSREPDATELQRSLAHIQGSTNQLDGIRDVLWVLLNTKEFIVNH